MFAAKHIFGEAVSRVLAGNTCLRNFNYFVLFCCSPGLIPSKLRWWYCLCFPDEISHKFYSKFINYHPTCRVNAPHVTLAEQCTLVVKHTFVAIIGEEEEEEHIFAITKFLTPSCNGAKFVLSKGFYLSRNLSTTSTNMVKTALVILAQGAEEMETVITVDMLRRGGVDVTLAGLDGDGPVLCSRNVTLVPNKSLADALAEKPQYDAVILPGGLEGSDRLSKSSVVGTLLKEHEKAGKIVAAICAAPTAFVAHGVAHGKRVTSYPSTKNKMPAENYKYVEGERVVVDGNIVTSRGPGTAYWFGLSLIEILVDKDTAAQVEKGMIITGY